MRQAHAHAQDSEARSVEEKICVEIVILGQSTGDGRHLLIVIRLSIHAIAKLENNKK
jgi:hypothetical protein